jgi:predicted GNAT family acetyltransferase
VSDLVVRDNATRSRYELVDGDRLIGFTEYRPRDGVLVFPHTVILHHQRGAGHATRLVQGALDDVRRKGMLVVPECSFVAEFIEEHPEYADLVAPHP